MVAESPTEVRSIEQLKALAGQELGVGKWAVITQEQVNAFADLTGDHQYIHVDPERARTTMFGGTIAHGYLTLSLLPLLGREREGVRVNLGGRMAVNYGLNRVRFPGPVPVGTRIRLRTKLLDVEALNPGAGPDGKPQAVQLTYQQTVEVEGAERPGMVAETLIRIYF
jgi:acyl dehydratase